MPPDFHQQLISGVARRKINQLASTGVLFVIELDRISSPAPLKFVIGRVFSLTTQIETLSKQGLENELLQQQIVNLNKQIEILSNELI